MSSENIYELKNCNGEIHWRVFSLQIEFTLTCERDGRITISPIRIQLSKRSKFLIELHSTKGISVQQFSLSGYNLQGIRIKTNSAYLSYFEMLSTPKSIDIDFKISTDMLELSYELSSEQNPGKSLRLEYFVPGLQCHGTVSVETAYGKLEISGPTKVQNYDELTGIIAMEAPSNSHPFEPKRIDEIDSAVRRILDILSFAEGRFMRWSIRYILIEGRQVSSILFRGPMPSSKPRFPVFSYLNLEPLIHLAMKTYTDSLCKDTGIDLAIEWFLMHPKYSEAQFFTAMTALEHLIHVFSENHPQGGFLPRTLFKDKIVPLLKIALKDAIESISLEISSDRDDAFEAMSQKLGNLNQRTLRTNLQALLNFYQVPTSDIEHVIPMLIKLRNDIVHVGHQPKTDRMHSLSYYIAILRELLTRLFLSLIQYKGEYQSYLNGPEWKHFPNEKFPKEEK